MVASHTQGFCAMPSQPRLIAKLQTCVDDLDKNLKNLNDVYAEGAVEGFSDETLGL